MVCISTSEQPWWNKPSTNARGSRQSYACGWYTRILAHHGKLEHGSPVLPMTLEAIVLHYADNFDGDARGAIDHLQRDDANLGAFTERSLMHDTKLYRGRRPGTKSNRRQRVDTRPDIV